MHEAPEASECTAGAAPSCFRVGGGFLLEFALKRRRTRGNGGDAAFYRTNKSPLFLQDQPSKQKDAPKYQMFI